MSGFAPKRREALFRRIASAHGGAAALLLNPELLAKAQVRLDELKPMAVAEMQAAVRRICSLANAEVSADLIFGAAHDVRGLAGGYGFTGAGVVAGAIRAYGQNQTSDFQPDWALLQLLAQMLTRTFEDSETPPQALASVCREAVAKVMTREGRAPPEGAL